MFFNSFDFLIFFPLVTIIFYLLPHKFRWMWLLAASCYFYLSFLPLYLLVAIVAIIIAFYAAIWMEEAKGKKRKLILISAIIITSPNLIAFKYCNFFIDNINSIATFFRWNHSIKLLNIIMPLGLSFHTFQQISYLVDVYKGKVRAERNIGIYALFILLYCKLIAGPIERAESLLPQFHKKQNFNYDNISIGLKIMLWGIIKKVVIADRLGLYVNSVYDNYQMHTTSSYFLATFFYSIQVYCNFSGYSEIALGAAKTMGFDLTVNFKRPLFARSAGEFWKRWHISLSSWMKDYIYIPLGGSRVKHKSRLYYNLLITFTFSGFWHGANWTYVLWGFINGFYLVFALIVEKQTKWVRKLISIEKFPRLDILYNVLMTFTLMLISRVFFRSNSIEEVFHILPKLFSFKGALYIEPVSNLFYSILGILVLLAVEFNEEYKVVKFSLFYNTKPSVRFTAYTLALVFLLMFGVFDGGQFIYFQF